MQPPRTLSTAISLYAVRQPGVWRWTSGRPLDNGGCVDVGFALFRDNAKARRRRAGFRRLEAKRAAKRDITFDIVDQDGSLPVQGWAISDNRPR
jgi:hypothetical protein